jgi:hypothetical protein
MRRASFIFGPFGFATMLAPLSGVADHRFHVPMMFRHGTQSSAPRPR